MNDSDGVTTRIRRILLIEDDEPLRISLRDILQRLGFVVAEAADGKQGLSALRLGLPDAIITDIVMPECDGLEFLDALRTADVQIPIIAMSGHHSHGLYLPLAQCVGAACTLLKPFSLEQLLATLHGLAAKEIQK